MLLLNYFTKMHPLHGIDITFHVVVVITTGYKIHLLHVYFQTCPCLNPSRIKNKIRTFKFYRKAILIC